MDHCRRGASHGTLAYRCWRTSPNVSCIIRIKYFKIDFRLETDNTVPFIILHADTRILLGGSDGSIHQFKNNGKQISSVTTGSDIIYSLAVCLWRNHLIISLTNIIFRNRPVVYYIVVEIEIQSMSTNTTDTELTKLFSKTAHFSFISFVNIHLL